MAKIEAQAVIERNRAVTHLIKLAANEKTETYAHGIWIAAQAIARGDHLPKESNDVPA
jgi:hypothetical protein